MTSTGRSLKPWATLAHIVASTRRPSMKDGGWKVLGDGRHDGLSNGGWTIGTSSRLTRRDSLRRGVRSREPWKTERRCRVNAIGERRCSAIHEIGYPQQEPSVGFASSQINSGMGFALGQKPDARQEGGAQFQPWKREPNHTSWKPALPMQRDIMLSERPRVSAIVTLP